jgi:hypothetical protein
MIVSGKHLMLIPLKIYGRSSHFVFLYDTMTKRRGSWSMLARASPITPYAD